MFAHLKKCLNIKSIALESSRTAQFYANIFSRFFLEHVTLGGESNDIDGFEVSNETSDNQIGDGVCEPSQPNENERQNLPTVDEAKTCNNDMSIEGTV